MGPIRGKQQNYWVVRVVKLQAWVRRKIDFNAIQAHWFIISQASQQAAISSKQVELYGGKVWTLFFSF